MSEPWLLPTGCLIWHKGQAIDPHAALEALGTKLEAMERMRIVLDAFQQDAQTRLKDYDPRQVNEWIVRIKAAAQEEQADPDPATVSQDQP